jgi:carbohydrate kinase (thermoresistant glucokinase family)
MACSALRRAYRDRIRSVAPKVVFVHLDGTRELLAGRIAARTDHFMPSTLLESQLATLEPLEPDEAGLVMDVGMPVVDLVDGVAARLREGQSLR